MDLEVIFYILVMAVVTYIIRVLPLTIFRKEIKNPFIRSFLFYVPFVTLSVMIFPAVLDATASVWSALAGFVTAILLAYAGGSLVTVSMTACLAVFIVEMFL